MTAKETKITESDVAALLATDDKWLEMAILRLWQRQTELEKATESTYYKNRVGMQQADARMFSRFADKIVRKNAAGIAIGECLSAIEKRYARRPWHRSRVPQPTICKYRRQVLQLIEAKRRPV